MNSKLSLDLLGDKVEYIEALDNLYRKIPAYMVAEKQLFGSKSSPKKLLLDCEKAIPTAEILPTVTLLCRTQQQVLVKLATGPCAAYEKWIEKPIDKMPYRFVLHCIIPTRNCILFSDELT